MVKTETHPANASPPSSSSAKRKKGEDSIENGAKKKPRTRVSYSCGECHRRKQKCDRQVPCSHCIARRVPDLCKAYTPGKSDQDIHARLSRLERIIDEALPQYASAPGSPAMGNAQTGGRTTESGGSPPPPAEDDDGSQGEDGVVGPVSKWYPNAGPGRGPAMLEQLQLVGPHDAAHRDAYMVYRATVATDNSPMAGDADSDSPMLQKSEPTAADLLQSLIRDCGLSENKPSELLDELPDRRYTGILIDHFFHALNWTRYPISEDDFRTSYDSLLLDGVGSNPKDVRFLPLFFVVLAISVRLSPEHIGGNAQARKTRSMQFYWSSRRALLIAAAIQPDSLEMVLTRLMSARYLTFDRRITECWSQLGAAVCTAQALGLHRDPSSLRLEPSQVEYRRRIWAYLYHADRSYALVLGRPYSIQDEYSTTQPPLNIEDLPSLPTDPNTPPLPAIPLTNPTRMTFVILRHGLAYLIGKIVHFFQRVRIQNHYADVLGLDDQLQRFIDTLPPHFSFTPDTSLDGEEGYDYIPVHRYLLTTEILFVRISLHRPYFLRRLDTDRFARSRQAVFSAATMDFSVRQAFRRRFSKEVVAAVSNAYREFTTAMISGIYLALDPNGKDSKAMHAILDSFLNDHEGLEDIDVTTRREVNIVELLKRHASQREHRSASGRTSQSPSNANEQSRTAQARLLLNLQGSSSSMLDNAPAPNGLTGVAATTPILLPSYNNPLAMQVAPTSARPIPFIGPMLPNGVQQGPPFQRLQNDIITSASRQSPSGSGSGEEDMSAQLMLDQWYNAVTNPPMLADTFGNGSLGMGDYGAYAGGMGDVSWMNAPAAPHIGGSMNGDVQMQNGLEGADYNLWLSLVNQIRGGPVQ